MALYHIIISSLFLVNYVNGAGDVFTSVASLEELLSNEKDLIDTLENYIEAELQKISNLRRYADFFKREHGKAEEYSLHYVQNPINSFKLIRRMVEDCNKVEMLMNNNNTQVYLETIEKVKESSFPTDTDLEGAGTALKRLRDMYDMNVSSIANGVLDGVQYDTELSVVDCYSLGHRNYIMGNYKESIPWLHEAEARLEADDENLVPRVDLLFFIYKSAVYSEDADLALNTANRWLEMYPDDERAQLSVLEIKQKIKESLDPRQSKEHYRDVCTNKSLLPAEITSKLKCRYVNNNNPYLRIGPFKLEEAFLDPDIFIYHDVLGDDEIAFLKEYSAESRERSEVSTPSGGSEQDNMRISQSGYLSNGHKIVNNILLRANNMTRLDRSSYEFIQVANYGIGGFYYSHYDFTTKAEEIVEEEQFSDLGVGNRIATILFYLSDVEQGGATAFPLVNAAGWPKKGSAVFWYNLFPSGDGDYRTLHSACPVLVGSKWVATFWIHEHFQEFIRPCTLERPPEHLII